MVDCIFRSHVMKRSADSSCLWFHFPLGRVLLSVLSLPFRYAIAAYSVHLRHVRLFSTPLGRRPPRSCRRMLIRLLIEFSYERRLTWHRSFYPDLTRSIRVRIRFTGNGQVFIRGSCWIRYFITAEPVTLETAEWRAALSICVFVPLLRALSHVWKEYSWFQANIRRAHKVPTQTSCTWPGGFLS